MAKTSFGERVKQARLAKAMSLRTLAIELAQATNTKSAKSLISQWEVGRVKSPKVATIYHLHRILGVSLPWLMLGIGEPHADDAAAPCAGGSLDEPRLERSIRLALGIYGKERIAAARLAVLFYRAISSADEIDDQALVDLVRFGRSAP